MSFKKYKTLLRDLGFISLLITQFLGALNDNLYRMVVSLFAVEAAAAYGGGSLYLSLAGAIFILPFFLFSGYAGYFSDVFSKRKVLISMKVAELLIMSLAILAFRSESIIFMLVILFLMALQSTFFSPAKYGIIPEMVAYEDLSRANGLLEMSTFFAIIVGTSLGSLIYWMWKTSMVNIGLVVVSIAITGTLMSLGITKVPPSGATKPFNINPWSEIIHGMGRIYRDRTLWLTVVGATYFWFLGALLQMNILLLGKEVMGLDDKWVGIMIAFIGIGIGLGSFISGRLSGDKIEPALVPLGSIGMGIFSMLVYYFTDSYAATVFVLMCVGFSGGLFIVPISALIQQRSGKEEKGRVIATNNFMNTGGIIVASGALYLFRDMLQIQADRILQLLGIVTFLVTAYIVKIMPDFFIRFILWSLIHTVYRIRTYNEGYINNIKSGLIFTTYTSGIVPFLIGASLERHVRFVLPRHIYEKKWAKWFFKLMKVIPVTEDIQGAVNNAIRELRQGHHVCLFIEGMDDPHGNLKPFIDRLGNRVNGLSIPCIPVCLSHPEERILWRWKVSVVFGKALIGSFDNWQALQRLRETECEALLRKRAKGDILPYKFIKIAKNRWVSSFIADSTGNKLTYGKLLIASVILSNWLRNRVTGSMVGILLPASAGGVIANIATALASKVSVNINFKTEEEFIKKIIEQCEITTILTSREFMKRVSLKELEGMVFIEDIFQNISTGDRVRTFLKTFIFPAFMLKRLLRLNHTPYDPATVLFSSGSTGEPKGVILSHHGILSNIESFMELFPLSRKDRLMGILPFFHAFGLTCSLWFPLIAGIGAVYHVNPLDARTIGDMVRGYRASILLSAPTFTAAYLNRCGKDEFSTLRYVIVGAEKLSPSLEMEFKRKFGIPLYEGYGCTEMGPVISVNAPDVSGPVRKLRRFKSGSVGKPIPGVAVKVIDLETDTSLPPGERGLLLVKGGGQMLGYLNNKDLTREAMRDGWYVTGDIGMVDEEGFVYIVDRISRFSKIGGEMVPHLKIEEAVNNILKEGRALVVSLNEGRERLFILYTDKQLSPQEIWKGLCASSLPRLWIPSMENIIHVESIPLLGTGKVDFIKARQLVQSNLNEFEMPEGAH